MIRKSGIDLIGDVPWGTHFCQFYETKEDLIDILVPYFKAGLEHNEFCMWITSEPLDVKEANKALKAEIPDLDAYHEKGQIEIIPYDEWYVRDDVFDSERVINGWVEKLNGILEKGFAGVTVSGNTFWLREDNWNDFIDYEEEVDKVIGRYNIMAMCTYCLDKCNASEIIDVVNNHQFAIIKRGGEWSLLESSKQKIVEEELNSTSKKFDSLFNNMLDGYAHCEMIYDNLGNPKDFIYLNVNDAFERITGLYDVEGKKVSEAIPGTKEMHPELFEIYSRVATTGNPERFEIEFKPLEMWLDIAVHSPQKKQFVAIFEDITRRKKTEIELMESENRYHMVADFTYDWEEWINTNKKFEYVSPSCERITGYSAQEFMDNTNLIFDIIHPDDLESYKIHFEEVFLTEEPKSIIFRVKNRDGKIHWIEHICQAIFDKEGRFRGRRASNRDITEKREAEEHKERLLENEQQLIEKLEIANAELQQQRDDLTSLNQTLRRNERRLNRAQEIAHLGSWELDLQTNRLSWSDEVYRIFGLQPQEFEATYEAFLDSVHPDDRAAVDEAYSGSLSENNNGYEIEHRVLRKSTGEVRIVHEKCEHFRNEDGNIIRSVGMVHDITERKKTEKEMKDIINKLEISNQELEQFGYVASHDLQEPLRMVASFSQLLEKRYREQLDSDADDYIDFIVEGAKRMKDLIDDLLAFSQLNTEAKEFKLTDLTKALDGVLFYLKASIDENNVTITHDQLPIIKVDPSQIRQLFQNLISNAIKFHSDKPPEIHISAQGVGKEWKFGVSDNGIGIDAEHQKKIFDVFRRLHTRDEFEGTGIGLAICKRIVNRHGGQIWVESEPGKGSTLYFTIPKTK